MPRSPRRFRLMLLLAVVLSGSAAHSAPCDKPCVLVPRFARQGELITVRFSAFPHNGQVKFTLDGRWLINWGQYQAGAVDSIDYRLPEGLPDGDYQIIGEYGTGGERVAAQATVRVSGAHHDPTVEVVPPSDAQRGWYRIGVHKIHVKGLRWTLGGHFGANLTGVDRGGLVDGARIYRLTAPPLDACLGAGGGLIATICDARGGEVNQFWPLEANVVPGRYMVEFMDGLSRALSQTFDVLPATDEIKKPIPQPPPLPRPPPPPPVITPPVAPDPQPVPVGRICNPNLPNYQQKNCVEVPPPQRPVVPTRCNSSVPSYSQPNCIP